MRTKEAAEAPRKVTAEASLADELKSIADASGFSRREIARLLGHDSPSTVQRILGSREACEKGSLGTLRKIASVLGYDLKITLVRREYHG